MNCARFQDRLYDEDSRQAQRGAGRVPEDLASHMETCVSCREGYEQAVKDEITFARRLRQEPSAVSRARMLERIQDAEARRPTPWTRWVPIVSDVLTAGAVAVALSGAVRGPGSLAWQVSVFSVGGALTLFGPRLKEMTQHIERSVRFLFAPY